MIKGGYKARVDIQLTWDVAITNLSTVISCILNLASGT